MAVILAQVSLPHDNALPEDVTVNTLYFNGAASTTVGTSITNAIIDFFTGANTTATIASRLSSDLSGTINVKCYNIDDPKPRVPFYEASGTMTVGSSALPSEVAVCLSFQATKVSGLDQARRRGRIFIGPLANLSGATGVFATGSTVPRPIAAFRTDLLVAAKRLQDTSDTNNHPWVVYSRMNDTTAVVANGWVDDAFDTQRRRGIRPSTRSTLTF